MPNLTLVSPMTYINSCNKITTQKLKRKKKGQTHRSAKAAGGNSGLFQNTCMVSSLPSFTQEPAHVSKVSTQLMIGAAFEAFLIRDSVSLCSICGKSSNAVLSLNSQSTEVDCSLLSICLLNSKSKLMHSVRFPCQHYSRHAPK